MKYLKKINEHFGGELMPTYNNKKTEPIAHKSNFEEEKSKIIEDLKKFMDDYSDFLTTVSPDYWRSSGHHYSELNKMIEDINRFKEITEEESKRDWVDKEIKRKR